MTMNARIKRYRALADREQWDADTLPTGQMKANGWENPRDGFLVECEMFHPKSVKGRTVLLRLTEKDRDDLLLILRSDAIRARRATEEEG